MAKFPGRLLASKVVSTVWINEAVDVSSVGTKRPSLTTRFEGPYDTMQLIWNKVKSVAALYSAAMTCTQNQSRPLVILLGTN
jgi:hypothetical protein